MGRVPDVNVRSRSRTGHGVAKRNKWNARAAQVSHQRLAFAAVGAQGDVYRVSVIEAHMIVDGRLSKRADG